MSRTYLTPEQHAQLLAPINPVRVLDLKGRSYLAQHDVRAHLTRIFGFANWSTRVISLTCVDEHQGGSSGSNWLISYLAHVELTVCAWDGTPLATYQDVNGETCAPQPDKGNAHALAATSAVSTALKRCAANLGDQFGASLYEKGSKKAIVKGTLVGPGGPMPFDEPAVTDMGDEPIGEQPTPTPGQPEHYQQQVDRVRGDAAPIDGNPDPTALTPPAEPVTFQPSADTAEAIERWMSDLRSFAANPDGEQRMLNVVMLKNEATQSFQAGFLKEMVEAGGRTMARGILADEVAAGKWLPAAES